MLFIPPIIETFISLPEVIVKDFTVLSGLLLPSDVVLFSHAVNMPVRIIERISIKCFISVNCIFSKFCVRSIDDAKIFILLHLSIR